MYSIRALDWIDNDNDVCGLEGSFGDADIIDNPVVNAIGAVAMDCACNYICSSANPHCLIECLCFLASDFAYNKRGIPKPESCPDSIFSADLAPFLCKSAGDLHCLDIVAKAPERVCGQFQRILNCDYPVAPHYLNHKA